MFFDRIYFPDPNFNKKFLIKKRNENKISIKNEINKSINDVYLIKFFM